MVQTTEMYKIRCACGRAQIGVKTHAASETVLTDAQLGTKSAPTSQVHLLEDFAKPYTITKWNIFVSVLI